MHLLLILAVLGALMVSEHGPSQPVGDAPLRLVLSLAAMLIPPLLAAIIAKRVCRRLQRGDGQAGVLRGLRVWRAVHAVIWVTAAGTVLVALGWARLVRFDLGLDHAFLLDEFLVLLPVLLPLALSWAAWFEVDRELRRRAGFEPAAPGGEAEYQEAKLETCPAGLSGRWTYIAVYARHYLGILLVPVFALLAIQDAAHLLLPQMGEGVLLGAFYAPAILMVAILFPALLRHVWETQPLGPGSLRDRLEAIGRQAGFRAREILVWNTGGMMLNAAVAGFFPALRYVFLTDGLLKRLTDEQVQAVYGHEIGHLWHRHLLLRVVAMFAPLSLWLLVDQVFPGFLVRFGVRFHLAGLGHSAMTALLVLGGLAGYMVLVFGPYCRLLEGQADLFGCRALAGDAGVEPVATYVAALENLAMAGAIDRNRSSWQHASIASRVELLKRIVSDPAFESRFHRRIRVLSGLMVAIAVSPLACRLLALA